MRLRETSDGGQTLMPRIVGVNDVRNAALEDERSVVLTPDASGASSISLALVDATDDSGWWSYPLMHGACELRLLVTGNATSVFEVTFPRSIHPLPTESFCYCNGAAAVAPPGSQEHAPLLYDEYQGYPDVHLTFIYRLQDAGRREIHFSSRYREAEQVVAIPVLFPCLINMGIIGIGFAMGSVADSQSNAAASWATFHTARSVALVAVLPLYLALWNSSNVLKSIPTLVNLITTVMVMTIAVNLLIAFIWLGEVGTPTAQLIRGVPLSASRALAIGYAFFAVWTAYTVLRFVFHHQDNDLWLIRGQRALYRAYGFLGKKRPAPAVRLSSLPLRLAVAIKQRLGRLRTVLRKTPNDR